MSLVLRPDPYRVLAAPQIVRLLSNLTSTAQIPNHIHIRSQFVPTAQPTASTAFLPELANNNMYLFNRFVLTVSDITVIFNVALVFEADYVKIFDHGRDTGQDSSFKSRPRQKISIICARSRGLLRHTPMSSCSLKEPSSFAGHSS